MSIHAVGSAVLAAVQKVQKVPKSGEGVKSGPIGLAVILLLCAALYFLCKSMSKHLRRVRDDFPMDSMGRPIVAPQAAVVTTAVELPSAAAGQDAGATPSSAPPPRDST